MVQVEAKHVGECKVICICLYLITRVLLTVNEY